VPRSRSPRRLPTLAQEEEYVPPHAASSRRHLGSEARSATNPHRCCISGSQGPCKRLAFKIRTMAECNTITVSARRESELHRKSEEPSRFHWHSSSDSHRRTAFYCHKDTLFPNSPNCRASSPQLRPSAPFDELPEFEADSLSEAVRGVTFPVCGLVFLDGSRRSASSIASLRGGSVSPLTLSGVRRVEGKDIFCDLAAELPVRGGCRWWSDRAT